MEERLESGSFSADRSGSGGGADVTGGSGTGDGGAKGTRRRSQADSARTRGGSQDGKALAEVGRLATAAKPVPAPRRSISLPSSSSGARRRSGWNGVVLHRELVGLGFTGGYLQVQRFLQPFRAQRKWSAARDGTLRDRARRTGSGRLRSTKGLDRRAGGNGPSVRVHAGLFAPAVHARISQRAAGDLARRPRARISLFRRRDPELPVR